MNFPSLKLASEHMNVLNSYLCTRIKNNEKCGGFYWQYVI